MSDIVKVIVEAHREELMAERVGILADHVVLDQELFTLVDDVNEYVKAMMQVQVVPEVSNGICVIQTEYVPNPIINWAVDSIIIRLKVTVGSSPSVDYFDRLELQTAHSGRYKQYAAKRAALNVLFDANRFHLNNIHEKEVQLKGEITLGLLTELGLDYLLVNEKVQEVLGVQIADGWVEQPITD
jgi:hypothetical protein